MPRSERSRWPECAVKVEEAVSSVPCEWAGLDITAHIGAAEVELVGPCGRVVHPRMRFGQRARLTSRDEEEIGST